MQTLLTSSRAELLEAALQLLWRQWSALGVAGVVRDDGNEIIDPEALLLITTVFSRYEARLFDEVLDWLRLNGNRLNLQRLRNLHEAWPAADLNVLGAMADVLGGRSSLHKWAALDSTKRQPPDSPAQSLFTSAQGMPMPVFGKPDADFARHGLLRATPKLRGMSRAPSPDTPANFLFKLRALFGLSARADILAWLLSTESGHPAEIARRTGWFSKTVQVTLNEMEFSGHVRSRRAQRKKYFWVQREEWRFLLTWQDAGSFPRWVNWAPIFSAVTTVFTALSLPGIEDQSAALQALRLRPAFEDAVAAIGAANLGSRLQAGSRHRGAEFVKAVVEDFIRLLR
jgi:hypothetical protein